jgi:hypothetical protein
MAHNMLGCRTAKSDSCDSLIGSVIANVDAHITRGFGCPLTPALSHVVMCARYVRVDIAPNGSSGASARPRPGEYIAFTERLALQCEGVGSRLVRWLLSFCLSWC